MTRALIAAALLISATPVSAQTAGPAPAPAPAAAGAAVSAPGNDPPIIALQRQLAGRWQGELEYPDYPADRWFGIPMIVIIEDEGDGATLIRKADFDDGPRVGNVRITSVSLFSADGARESVGTFRKGRDAELTVYQLAMPDAPRDATHWTIIATTAATDDDRPAMLRETTTRDGDGVTTLKEVDFLDDTGETWLARNRTRLTRVGDVTAAE